MWTIKPYHWGITIEAKPTPDELRLQIAGLVEQYFKAAFPVTEFVAGTSELPVTGKVFDEKEMQYLVDSALDFWLTTGRFRILFNGSETIATCKFAT